MIISFALEALGWPFSVSGSAPIHGGGASMDILITLVTILALWMVFVRCLSRFSFSVAHSLWPWHGWTVHRISTLTEIWSQLCQYLLNNPHGIGVRFVLLSNPGRCGAFPVPSSAHLFTLYCLKERVILLGSSIHLAPVAAACTRSSWLSRSFRNWCVIIDSLGIGSSSGQAISADFCNAST